MKRVAVLTSGGDSPGMNAAIRAVVKTAYFYQIEVFGVLRGYEGLIQGTFEPLNLERVHNIIHRGGTILKSARSERFKTEEGRKQAYEHLLKHNIDAVIAVGGDGTYTGAKVFCEEFPEIAWIGLPGTIDNDLYGTDFTIGYDTAINTAMEAIDRIRDTADALNRLFIVEVMGRDAGFIALRSGIASGAEAVLIPESKADLPRLLRRLEQRAKNPEHAFIVVVAEGDEIGSSLALKQKLQYKYPRWDIRVVVLGHLQRGGAPTCADRVLASELGFAAVEALRKGIKNVAIGKVHKEIHYTPFEQAIKHHNDINPNLLRLLEILA